MEDTKLCTGECGRHLPATTEHFYKGKAYKGGLRPICKECTLKNCKEYKDSHKENERKRANQYYQNNKEKKREYDYKHRDKKIKYSRNYYKENREELLQKRKQYCSRDEFKQQSREWYNNKYANDPTFKLKEIFRNRFKKFMEGDKTNTIKEYLGCSYEELIVYIESLWTEGMSWDNHGFYGWHVDHKKPLSSFDYSDENKERSLREAWHHTNLQPLWAKENLSKGSKYQPEATS